MDQIQGAFLSLRTSSTRKPGKSDYFCILVGLCLLLELGCSPPSNPNYRIAELDKASRQISEREQQCIDAANKRAEAALSQLEKAQSRDNGQQIQNLNDQHDWELSSCETETDRENEALSSKERAEYEREAEEAEEAAAHAASVRTAASTR